MGKKGEQPVGNAATTAGLWAGFGRAVVYSRLYMHPSTSGVKSSELYIH